MNKTLFWGGVILVGFWWMKNSGSTSTNLLGFGSNPTQDNDLTFESFNWFSKMEQGTPALTNSDPRVTPTISGNFHF